MGRPPRTGTRAHLGPDQTESEVRVYTRAEAMKLLGLGRGKFAELIRSGRLRYTHDLGERSKRISHQELQRFLAGCEVVR